MKRKSPIDSTNIQNESMKRKSPMDSPIILHAFASRVVTQVLEKEAASGFKENIACSPLSLDAMLNMTAAGAGGRTLEQLLEFLESDSMADLNTKSSRLLALANPLEKGDGSGGGDPGHGACFDPVGGDREGPLVPYSMVNGNQKAKKKQILRGMGRPLVSFANGVWVDQRFTLKPSYQQIMDDVFKAEAKAVDFRNKVDEAIYEVNSWVAKSTNGFIKEILASDMTCRDTMLILGNALFFKGSWTKPFYESRNEEKDFYLLNGEIASVHYLCNSGRYYYRSHEDYQILKLPYKSGQDSRKFSMYIFLPREKNGLNNLIQEYKCFNTNLGFIHEQFQLRSVFVDIVRIPKFKFSYTFDPSKVMKELGLTLPFDARAAELTEMVYSLNGDLPYIPFMIRKSAIEVNEEGTEAASCTIEPTTPGYCPTDELPPSINFIAEHPFLFMIREDTSGVVFFLGAVVNPLL